MDIIQVLERYFVYIYPGFITVLIGQFSRAKATKLNKATCLISIVISYVYIIIYRIWCNRAVEEFNNYDYLVVLLISIIVPVLWHWICESPLTEKVLFFLGFETSIEDNVWDYIKSRDDKKQGIVIKIFLDNQGIMYEGSLRYHESDLQDEQKVCLSGYRRYIRNKKKYILKNDYSNDHSRWVLVNVNDVTRVEIKYETEK